MTVEKILENAIMNTTKGENMATKKSKPKDMMSGAVGDLVQAGYPKKTLGASGATKPSMSKSKPKGKKC
jgi:hypothetical protein